MIWLKEKKVKEITRYGDVIEYMTNYDIEDILHPAYIPKIVEVCTKMKETNYTEMLNSIENPTFYFGKTSIFPRTRLKLSEYKKVNNCEKSNIQVIGNNIITEGEIGCVFETQDCFYIMCHMNHIFCEEDKASVGFWDRYKVVPNTETIDKKIKYLQNKFNLNEPIYCGKIYWVSSEKEREDVTKMVTGEFNNIIRDNTLDIVTSNKLDNITIEDVDTLYDMLSGWNIETLELGLKLLAGYNYIKYPCLTKILLKNHNLKKAKNWHAHNITQIKNSIGFMYTFDDVVSRKYYIFQTPSNKEDLYLCHYLWNKLISSKIERDMNEYCIPGLKYKCHAEQVDCNWGV